MQKEERENSYLQYLSRVWSIVEKSSCAFSIFPEGGALQGVCARLQASGMISFEILPPHGANGHLVEVTELKQELDRWRGAARDGCVISNTPVLPLGVWTNNTLNEAWQTCSATCLHIWIKEKLVKVCLKCWGIYPKGKNSSRNSI